MKEKIAEILAGLLKEHLSVDAVEKAVEIPPSDDLGDYAFPCFSLSKVLKKNPAMIATDLKERIGTIGDGVRVEVKGGYLNFFVDKRKLAESVIKLYVGGDITDKSILSDYTASSSSNKECTDIDTDNSAKSTSARRVVVEFASPNTNKPLHLGHLRNMSIGDSIARILSFCGCEVFKASINNDRGVHICKSMLAYKRRGNGATPESVGVKSDHFVGDYYVMFNDELAKNPSLADDAQKMLMDWEGGEADTVALWKVMNKWALSGFRETYKLFGIAFDKEYYESDIYKNGKEIVKEGLSKGIFYKREDGAVVVDLKEEKLDRKVLLRPDGTSVYIVQDLYLALLKDEEYKYDESFYVVGNEQDYHFAVLIAIFKKLGYDVAEKIKHLSYGMVELPEGKMKSREGTVVDADDLIFETKELAKSEVMERYDIPEADAEERSLRIALAAIKYQLLKIDIAKNMVFDPKSAISFEGDTGPYLLYSYARASSILRKSGGSKSLILPDTFESTEIKLVKKIAFFPEAVTHAQKRLSPSVIANYSFELAQIFNEFYHANQVIGSGGDVEIFRINLVASFRTVIKKCLGLMGIDAIEEM